MHKFLIVLNMLKIKLCFALINEKLKNLSGIKSLRVNTYAESVYQCTL